MTAAVPALTAPALAPVVEVAIARWSQVGLAPAAAEALKAVRFEVVDLGSTGYLGYSRPGVVQIDDDAAGWGWFVDRTPREDSEFLQSGFPAQRAAIPGSSAQGRMDLLTVVLHELGHQLGLADVAGPERPGTLMSDALAAGVRRLPDTTIKPLAAGSAQDWPGLVDGVFAGLANSSRQRQSGLDRLGVFDNRWLWELP